jgi:hypothetical protein
MLEAVEVALFLPQLMQQVLAAQAAAVLAVLVREVMERGRTEPQTLEAVVVVQVV